MQYKRNLWGRILVLSLMALLLLSAIPVSAAEVRFEDEAEEEAAAAAADVSKSPGNYLMFSISGEEGNLYLKVTGPGLEGTSQFYLNVNENTESGYALDAGKEGFDYLIADGVLYRYRDSGDSWDKIIAINFHNYGDKIVAAVPLSLMDIREETAVQALFRSKGDEGTDIVAYGHVEVSDFVAEISYAVQAGPDLDENAFLPDMVSNRSEPTIVLMGSPAIVLYLNNAYVEQGATAWDNVDGDISDLVLIDGSVHTETAGTYQIQYSVFNTEGIFARTSRTVRVIEPVLHKDRAAFSFSGSFSQSEAGEIALYDFQNDSNGLMSLSLQMSGGQLEMTIRDSKGFVISRGQHFENKAENYNDFREGDYTLSVRPIQILHNLSYQINLLMPVIMTEVFEEEEIPLGAVDFDAVTVPKTGGEEGIPISSRLLAIFVAAAVMMVVYRKTKSEANRL